MTTRGQYRIRLIARLKTAHTGGFFIGETTPGALHHPDPAPAKSLDFVGGLPEGNFSIVHSLYLVIPAQAGIHCPAGTKLSFLLRTPRN